MKVLMIGVDKKRTGGMWTVSKNYIENQKYNENVDLCYVSTSTSGNIFNRIIKMFFGFFNAFCKILFFKPDIIHLHMAEKGSVFRKGIVIYFSKIINCKIVVHMHAGPFMDWYDTLNARKQKKILKLFSQIDCLFVLGDYFKNQMKRIIDESKIKVLYNGISIPKINYYTANKNEKKYFLYSGRMNELKGVYDLLVAIKKCKDFIPTNIQFIFCGSDETGRFQKRVFELGLSDLVVNKGWIDSEEMNEYYKISKALILPSYSEGLSMTILEAMSYGLPVITTNITTMPEILNDICSLFLPGDIDELCKLIVEYSTEQELLDVISEKEYKRVSNLFSIDLMIERTLKYYEELYEK